MFKNTADSWSTPDYGYLIEGTDGRFYGATAAGGSNAGGTVFKITH